MPDLNWALRGAGSSYGIVAELDFQTFAAPETVTPFNIELDWNEKQAVEGLLALQKFGATAPKELNMQIYMAPTGQTIQGVYYGTRTALNTALKPLLAGEESHQLGEDMRIRPKSDSTGC